MIHYDIDSICTCKILQSLLKYKHILYTLAIIGGIDDLKTAYRENCNDVKYFILINCGGTIDIVEELEAEDDVTFFILDSHRPTDLCNIYSIRQVRLLSSPDDDALVPDFHDIFREEVTKARILKPLPIRGIFSPTMRVRRKKEMTRTEKTTPLSAGGWTRPRL